jgi:hypothetical protein
MGEKMKKNRSLPLFLIFTAVTMFACSAVSSLVATPTPVPTNTPIPSATPLPSPIPNPVLFEDSEFANSCSLESTAEVERTTENGQFNIRIVPANFVAWSECTRVEYSDFILEVDATQVGGPDNNIYGVLFRYGLDNNEFYVFAISGDGYYAFAVDGSERSEPEFIVPWAQTPAINLGMQTNHLKVVAVGSSISYYVNDQLLGEIQDSRLSKGVVGFFAGSLDVGDVKIAYDNLRITQP